MFLKWQRPPEMAEKGKCGVKQEKGKEKRVGEGAARPSKSYRKYSQRLGFWFTLYGRAVGAGKKGKRQQRALKRTHFVNPTGMSEYCVFCPIVPSCPLLTVVCSFHMSLRTNKGFVGSWGITHSIFIHYGRDTTTEGSSEQPPWTNGTGSCPSMAEKGNKKGTIEKKRRKERQGVTVRYTNTSYTEGPGHGKPVLESRPWPKYRPKYRLNLPFQGASLASAPEAVLAPWASRLRAKHSVFRWQRQSTNWPLRTRSQTAFPREESIRIFSNFFFLFGERPRKELKIASAVFAWVVPSLHLEPPFLPC